MALPLVMALGVVVNRGYYRRTGEASRRWLFTEEEATALAGALGRISARRLPEQLVDGEGGDLFVIVGVTGGYLVRNALGITEAQMTAAAAAAGQVPSPDQARPEPVRDPTPAPAAAADPVERHEPAPAPAGGAVLTAADVGAV